MMICFFHCHIFTSIILLYKLRNFKTIVLFSLYFRNINAPRLLSGMYTRKKKEEFSFSGRTLRERLFYVVEYTVSSSSLDIRPHIDIWRLFLPNSLVATQIKRERNGVNVHLLTNTCKFIVDGRLHWCAQNFSRSTSLLCFWGELAERWECDGMQLLTR